VKSLWLASLLVLSPGILDAADEKSGNAPIISEIRAVLDAQQEAWNRGDIDSFMNGYARADTTIFVSGDEVMRGWQTVRDRYLKKYSDRAKMGILAFSDLEIEQLHLNLAQNPRRLAHRSRSYLGGCATLVIR
jgi:hypothetical protein